MPTPFDSRRRPPGRRLSSGLSRAAADEREKFAQVLRPARVEAGTDLAGVPTATPRGGAGRAPRPAALLLHEPALDGPARQLVAVGQLQLAQYRGDVRLDRLRRDPEA